MSERGEERRVFSFKAKKAEGKPAKTKKTADKKAGAKKAADKE